MFEYAFWRAEGAFGRDEFVNASLVHVRALAGEHWRVILVGVPVETYNEEI
jgi:hypothetical protein